MHRVLVALWKEQAALALPQTRLGRNFRPPYVGLLRALFLAFDAVTVAIQLPFTMAEFVAAIDRDELQAAWLYQHHL